jgi:hypothetical protein
LKLTPADTEFDMYEPIYRFACGGTAALIGNVITYPLDVIRTNLTVSKDGNMTMKKSIKDIISIHGVTGLYRGLKPTLIAVVPFIAIQNTTIDILRDEAINDGYNATPLLLMGIGGFAGIFAQTIIYPLDVLRRRSQLALSIKPSESARVSILSDSTWLAMKQIAKQHGYKSLFAGIVPTFIKTIPTVSIVAVVTGSINSYFKKSNKLK